MIQFIQVSVFRTDIKYRNKILFRRFKEGKLNETEVVHLLGLVGLYDHTLPTELRKAFKRMRADSVTVNDTEVVEFFDAVAERFHTYLNRPDPRRAKASTGAKG